MKSSRTFAGLILLLVFCVSADVVFAAGGGGGGGGGGGRGRGRGRNNNNNNDDDENNNSGMKWHNSVGAGVGAAAEGKLPIMAVITRPENMTDEKIIAKIESWNVVAAMSRKDFVAVQIGSDAPEVAEMIKRLGSRVVPGVVWVDHFGNPLIAQGFPADGLAIQSMVKNWPNILTATERFQKDHISKGDTAALKSKLRDSYIEFAYVAGFKGPEPKKAKENEQSIKEIWIKLAQQASALPAESKERAALIKGVRSDVAKLDCAIEVEQALPPDKNAQKPGTVDWLIDHKSLYDCCSIATNLLIPVDKEVEAVAFDPRDIVNHTNKRISEAGTAALEGMEAFKKATGEKPAGGMDKKELFKAAQTSFVKSLTAIDAALDGKRDLQLDKTTEKLSMLIYACIKNQLL